MKKRIVCFILTLIMLIGLVPVSALTADAASNAISETAIYVLKQLEGYKKTCENGYIGYGAQCPECMKNGNVNVNVSVTHFKYEKEADKILREELKELDKAVNNFASKSGMSFSQSQHDALVLFSFQNGTAWTMGTGAFQTAIKSGYTGSKFLDAICKWNIDKDDDLRRMIEANMYLNGVYSSARPSRFIRVELDPTSAGSLAQGNNKNYHYFDVASPVTITLVPTPADKDNTFLGWYLLDDDGNYQRVATLTSAHHDKTLEAWYQNDEDKPGESFPDDILYTLKKASLSSTTVYDKPNGTKVTTYINELGKEVTIKMGDILYVVNDYIDANGVHWAKVAEIVEDEDGNEYPPSVFGWVKVKGGSSNSTSSGLAMDLNVTVTNTYVNMRKNASITSTKNGSFNMGDVLRIIDTKNNDGFLWGQVATSANDETPIGWVALMYTDYDSVVAQSNVSKPETTVATATITYTGYVNVRSEAGINNQIVGALSYGVTVDLYEVKYVNGIRWGRCATGWFCLTYAEVSGLDSNTGTGDAGFTNYIYIAKLENWHKDYPINGNFYKNPGDANPIDDKNELDSKGEEVLDKNGIPIAVKVPSDQIKIGSLRAVNVGGQIETWANTPYGWLKIAEHDSDAMVWAPAGMINITFEAKYYAVADDVTVREAPRTDAKRVDVLVKGTEFNVTEIVMVGESIWGYAEKVGEMAPYSYEGWVNLSNQNVSRNASGDYNVGTDSTAGTTVKMARVVGTESLRVRITGATYGKQIGSLSYGTTAKILEEKNGWYNLDIDVDNDPSTGSWVSGSYLEIYNEVQGGSSVSGSASNGVVETGKGIVANTYTGVNIRSGAGTAYPTSGKYMTGTTVEILEVKTVGASKWGRTEKGWVCMDYIAMVDKYVPAGSVSGTGSNTNTTTSSNIVIYTGTAIGDVTVYKNTNTAFDGAGGTIPVADAVATLSDGDPITLHEIIVQVEYDDDGNGSISNEGQVVSKRTSYWGRVNEGYIYAPGSNIALNTLDEHAYTVQVEDTKVYEEWSDIDPDNWMWELEAGTKVYVTRLQIRYSEVWGYVECADFHKEGWANLSNMDKGFASSVEPEQKEEDTTTNNNNTTTEPTTPPTVIGSTGNTGGNVSASGYKYTGKVINTNEVNVRATASTAAKVTTTLKNGAALVIYETVISEYMAWGRCDSGWVYLYYVDLTPVGNGAVDARVVYNDNTVIYADMNMTEATGSTYAKMAVVDIYEIVGKMARTELGWIHTDNLL